MPDDSFEKRFPTYTRAQQKRPPTTRSSSNEAQLRTQQLLVGVLQTALPLLKNHANFEPHAIPVTFDRKRLLRENPVVASWIFQQLDFIAGSGPGLDQDACSNYLFLTEQGSIGRAYDIRDGALITSGMHTLSLRGIRQIAVVPDPLSVQTNLSNILGEVGVAMPKVV